jgi:hypothetical protein
MDQDMKINQHPTAAKFFDIGQRLFSLFLSTALPAITTGAVIGVSVAKSAMMAGAMAVIAVVQKLAAASVDGVLTSQEIRDAFGASNGTKKKK